MCNKRKASTVCSSFSIKHQNCVYCIFLSTLQCLLLLPDENRDQRHVWRPVRHVRGGESRVVGTRWGSGVLDRSSHVCPKGKFIKLFYVRCDHDDDPDHHCCWVLYTFLCTDIIITTLMVYRNAKGKDLNYFQIILHTYIYIHLHFICLGRKTVRPGEAPGPQRGGEHRGPGARQHGPGPQEAGARPRWWNAQNEWKTFLNLFSK